MLFLFFVHSHLRNNTDIPSTTSYALFPVLPLFPVTVLSLHTPPSTPHKKPSVCVEHITHKSVTAWQVIAPNGCQHAEMWGGHCERRSETRGEYPSLSLFAQESDLTSKSPQDMNQHWRSRRDKDEGRETCTMFQIYAKNSGTRRDHICIQLFPGEINGCKWSYGSIKHRKITITIAMASISSCLMMGHSSCQIKKVLDLCTGCVTTSYTGSECRKCH